MLPHSSAEMKDALNIKVAKQLLSDPNNLSLAILTKIPPFKCTTNQWTLINIPKHRLTQTP